MGADPRPRAIVRSGPCDNRAAGCRLD